MSLLSFERFFRTSSRLSNEVEDENSDDEQKIDLVSRQMPTSTTSNFMHDDDNDSSFGLPSDASLSDHEVLVGFPPGTLLEIYRERRLREEDGSFGGTILSSAPSAEGMFPPAPVEPPHSAWPVVLPHPSFQVENIPPHLDLQPPFQVGNALSITTTESEYRNLQSLENSVMSGDDNMSTSTSYLSFSTLNVSSVPSSFVHSMDGENSERALVLRGGTYRNVADRLALEGNGEWFSQFTEKDWSNFRIAADMVLQALEPMNHSSPPLALPPLAPKFASEPVVSTVEYDLRDHLPEAFLCYLCQDAIVGATALSCACDKSTVCAECWEAHSTRVVETADSGFVYIETQNTCPSCQSTVHSAVPCHALDMALFHAIKNIPEPLQNAYYSRLDQWRREVIRRRQLESARQDPRHDLILAELIQQEEEYFWKHKANRNQTLVRSQQALLFIGEVAMCVAVASLSAVGLSVLARRS
jgi:hypothetical protein